MDKVRCMSEKRTKIPGSVVHDLPEDLAPALLLGWLPTPLKTIIANIAKKKPGSQSRLSNFTMLHWSFFDYRLIEARRISSSRLRKYAKINCCMKHYYQKAFLK